MNKKQKNMERRVGSSLTTAGGGYFVRGELNRNERSVRWTVAKIEIAGKQNQVKNMERRVEKSGAPFLKYVTRHIPQAIRGGGSTDSGSSRLN